MPRSLPREAVAPLHSARANTAHSANPCEVRRLVQQRSSRAERRAKGLAPEHVHVHV